MSSENSRVFTKDNLNFYLNELSKEYKKLVGRKTTTEIILIGGAAILERYGFREMTTDIDAILSAASTIKDAINHVGDRYGLPAGWLNADFMRTGSFSQQLRLYSVPLKTFNQTLDVRVVTGEYLIAMKLRSGRKYKNDLSDVVGILAEQEAAGTPISREMIDTAVNNLYGGWDDFPEDSVSFLRGVFEQKDFHELYAQIRAAEIKAKKVLLESQQANQGKLQAENIDTLLEQSNASVLAVLNQYKQQSDTD